MITSITDFYTGSLQLTKIFNSFIEEHKLQDKVTVDHLCYKCGSTESFETMREFLEFTSAFVYQSIISERRIAYIRLKEGIETSLGHIYYLELSDQKPDNSQKEGFDHIEIMPIGKSVDELATDLRSRGVDVQKVVRPHHTTYDFEVGEGFSVKLTTEPLVDKIKREEMR